MWRESQFQDILNARARETQFTTPSRSMRDAGASLRNTESKYPRTEHNSKKEISQQPQISQEYLNKYLNTYLKWYLKLRKYLKLKKYLKLENYLNKISQAWKYLNKNISRIILKYLKKYLNVEENISSFLSISRKISQE